MMTWEELVAERKPKPRKYNNLKVKQNGITFDSKGEARRWAELRLLQEGGYLSDLKRQVAFVLCPAVKLGPSQRTKPAVRIIVDFTYIENGKLILEDFKGVQTEAFRIKLHLLKDKYGHEVRLTK